MCACARRAGLGGSGGSDGKGGPASSFASSSAALHLLAAAQAGAFVCVLIVCDVPHMYWLTVHTRAAVCAHTNVLMRVPDPWNNPLVCG